MRTAGLRNLKCALRVFEAVLRRQHLALRGLHSRNAIGLGGDVRCARVCEFFPSVIILLPDAAHAGRQFADFAASGQMRIERAQAKPAEEFQFVPACRRVVLQFVVRERQVIAVENLLEVGSPLREERVRVFVQFSRRQVDAHVVLVYPAP